MRLNPKHPPGRASRKALLYAHEVRRLRAEGYTLEAIRQALFDVGISVSLSTVRREAARPPTLWVPEPSSEVPASHEDRMPGSQPADGPDSPIEGLDDHLSEGPFHVFIAAMRQFCGPR